jgi:hypothetical protein
MPAMLPKGTEGFSTKYVDPSRPFSSPVKCAPQRALGECPSQFGDQSGPRRVVVGAVIDHALGILADVIHVAADDDHFILQHGIGSVDETDHVASVLL